jgi:hypothetical protein
VDCLRLTQHNFRLFLFFRIRFRGLGLRFRRFEVISRFDDTIPSFEITLVLTKQNFVAFTNVAKILGGARLRVRIVISASAIAFKRSHKWETFADHAGTWEV